MEQKDEDIIANGIIKGGIGLLFAGFIFSLILVGFLGSMLL